MKKVIVSLFVLCISVATFGQRKGEMQRYFDDPVVTDSMSTIMIPTRYNADFIPSNKIVLYDYYANIIVYDFVRDSSRKLCAEDVFIRGFEYQTNYYNRNDRTKKPANVSNQWVFYFVKQTDFDNNGKVDYNDPAILYVSDKTGNNLKALTPANENAVSIDIYDTQGFALIKMQSDIDKDNDFEYNDRDFYYLRLDLKTLELGRKIETMMQ